MTSRGPYRRPSTPFKLQFCHDIGSGVIGRRDARRQHQISANLIQLWLTQFDRGELTSAEAEASVIAEYESRIAALERKVGQLTMELDFVKKTPRPLIGAENESSFIVTGPGTVPSGGDAKPGTCHAAPSTIVRVLQRPGQRMRKSSRWSKTSRTIFHATAIGA